MLTEVYCEPNRFLPTNGAMAKPLLPLEGNTLGSRIRFARLQKGWNRAEFVRELGKHAKIHYPQVDKWETKGVSPDKTNMKLISRVTGYPVEDFWQGLGQVHPSLLAADDRASERVDRLAEKFLQRSKLTPLTDAELEFVKLIAARDEEATEDELSASLLALRIARSKDTTLLPQLFTLYGRIADGGGDSRITQDVQLKSPRPKGRPPR